MDKTSTYQTVMAQLRSLLADEEDLIVRMASACALLHQQFRFWWTGFYLVADGQLSVGPYQGPLACTHIAYGKGVCGTAWQQGQSIVVPDVEQFPGHIACSAQSRSEVVVPLFRQGQVIAVLDIDSDQLGAFDDTDRLWLEQAACLVADREQEIYLAGGCFWGAEHFLKLIPGVTYTEVGFANGDTPCPTYRQVYTDTTGYAETVRIRYNPRQLKLSLLLATFLKAIDPTSLNHQGEDFGTRYRTGIYTCCHEDKAVARQVLAEAQQNFSDPIRVEVCPLQNFYRAEDEHQDYLGKHPDGYCHIPLELFELAKNTRG